jgi:glycosyltransferase involved in cell wall biosynthesis
MDNKPQKSISAVVFSKDRAMQLHAALESLRLHCRDIAAIDLHVLYKASSDLHRDQYDQLAGIFTNVAFTAETSFKQQVTDIVAGCANILFLVDDNIFVMDFRVADVLAALSTNPQAIGFSLRLGPNTVRCFNKSADMPRPAFEPAGENILKYDWRTCQHDFGYPLEISSSVYRSSEIAPLLKAIDFANPNILEGTIAANKQLFAEDRPYLLCFANSITFCNPLNMVQTVCVNRTGSDNRYSPRRLAEMFAQGARIDITQYNGLVTSGCHQDAELWFKQRNPARCPAEETDTKITAAGSLSVSHSNNPAVTIEMTAFNSARYITKAIESVLAQTFTDFELLIADDGSTDSTPDIIRRFGDRRIRYIPLPHKNCASARNTVITHARGRYLLCVDSDDFLAEDYLETILSYAQNHPHVDFFYPSRLVLVDANSEKTGTQWKYHDFSDNTLLPACLFAQGASVIPNPGSLKRRSLFLKTGLYDILDTVEDFVFLCKNALKMKFAMVTDCSDYFYRRLDTGLSRSSRTRDKITADTLNNMVSIYPPEVICPDIAGIGDNDSKLIAYCKYVAETFSKHADGYHMVSFGEHFRKYSDIYNRKLSILNTNRSVSCTG